MFFCIIYTSSIYAQTDTYYIVNEPDTTGRVFDQITDIPTYDILIDDTPVAPIQDANLPDNTINDTSHIITGIIKEQTGTRQETDIVPPSVIVGDEPIQDTSINISHGATGPNDNDLSPGSGDIVITVYTDNTIIEQTGDIGITIDQNTGILHTGGLIKEPNNQKPIDVQIINKDVSLSTNKTGDVLLDMQEDETILSGSLSGSIVGSGIALIDSSTTTTSIKDVQFILPYVGEDFVLTQVKWNMLRNQNIEKDTRGDILYKIYINDIKIFDVLTIDDILVSSEREIYNKLDFKDQRKVIYNRIKDLQTQMFLLEKSLDGVQIPIGIFLSHLAQPQRIFPSIYGYQDQEDIPLSGDIIGSVYFDNYGSNRIIMLIAIVYVFVFTYCTIILDDIVGEHSILGRFRIYIDEIVIKLKNRYPYARTIGVVSSVIVLLFSIAQVLDILPEVYNIPGLLITGLRLILSMICAMIIKDIIVVVCEYGLGEVPKKINFSHRGYINAWLANIISLVLQLSPAIVIGKWIVVPLETKSYKTVIIAVSLLYILMVGLWMYSGSLEGRGFMIMIGRVYGLALDLMVTLLPWSSWGEILFKKSRLLRSCTFLCTSIFAIQLILGPGSDLDAILVGLQTMPIKMIGCIIVFFLCVRIARKYTVSSTSDT